MSFNPNTLVLSSRKRFEISLATPTEVDVTDVMLPSSEPATPQASVTLQTADFPTFSWEPESVKYIGHLEVVVKNNEATEEGINYAAYRDGSLIKSGTHGGMNAGYLLTAQQNFYDVAAGDKIELAVWDADGKDIDLTRYYYGVSISRLQIESRGLMYNVLFENVHNVPAISGMSNVQGSARYGACNDIANTNMQSMTETWGQTGGDVTFAVMRSDKPIFFDYYSDMGTSPGNMQNYSSCLDSATAYPYFRASSCPDAIEYNRILGGIQ